MNRRTAAWTASLLLAFGSVAQSGAAQEPTSPGPIIDSQKPPAGFVGPKADGPRDLSMATYARASYLGGEEGIVDLRVLVRQDGSVGEAQISRSSGSAQLDQSALDVVKDWRYQPAMVNGSPVQTWIPVNIVWALRTLRFVVTKDLGQVLYTDELGKLPGGVSTIRFLVMPGGEVAKTIIDRSSGNVRFDEILQQGIMKSWRFRPGGVTAGGWYSVDITWGDPGSHPREGHDCLEPAVSAKLDTIIAACSQFLAAANLTSFQKSSAYGVIGLAYRVKGEFDMAIANYDMGIRFYPSQSTLFIGRARTHLSAGDKALALADFNSAIDVEPLSYRPYQARASFYFDDDQRDRALTDADSAVRVAKDADLPEAYNARCYYLAAMGRAQEALRDCDKALFRQPKNANILDSRGYAYLRLGRHQRAIQDYDAALKVDARLAASLYGRGVAKLKLGDVMGEVDITAAKALEPAIADRMAKIGVAP